MTSRLPFLASFILLASCAGPRPPSSSPSPSIVVAIAPPDAAPDASPDVAAPEVSVTDAAPDAAVAIADAAPAEGTRFAGETITAVLRQVAIYYEPQVDDAWRGYLRAGGTARIVRGPLGDEGCPAYQGRQDTGWYEVEGGGFVCVSRGAVLTRHLTRSMRQNLPRPPALDAGLPYRYGHVAGPLMAYRALPTLLEEQTSEPERFVTPVGEAGLESSAIVRLPGDRPPSLRDLEGAEGTPVLRRLTRGMYVSIDRGARAESGATFQRTHSGAWVRAGSLQGVGARPLHGVALGGEGARLPVAFVTAEGASLRRLGADDVLRRVAPAARLSAHPLESAEVVRWRTEEFLRARDGRLLRRADVVVADRTTPPPDLAPGEKWIEVNLDRQTLVAYEGDAPVYVALVSTGIPSRDEAANYETVQGAFRVQQKHVATTMDGDSAGGAYSIEDVPWVMYFEDSFALHGAYWHTGFGAVRSHGCVNLLPEDARWLFGWTAPALPAGWHAVLASRDDPGTRVYVRHERQALGERGGPEVVPGH
ncbi:MAG: L,D-transpeptidase [Polyangiales bacterium]